MVRSPSFDQRTERIRKYLRSDARYSLDEIPRPFFVEFTGTPSSGKTTTIKEVDKLFRHNGLERTWMPQEGAEVIRHISRATPVYNVRTGLYALQILLDESVGHKYDVVIFDRCIFDAYCWMTYWEEKAKLSPLDTVVFQSFFLYPHWANLIDAAFFMVCEPEVALRREQRISLSEKMGETTNPATIRKLYDRYTSAHGKLVVNHPQLTLIDTTKLSEQEMIERVTSGILDLFELKILSKHHPALFT